ncbi:hypothetical protein [Enhygromyxa salina]|uniref:hypothetical protein n=1 Tax=Enhygromyxa salina TaxID=215803 RepID=UPI0011B25DAB|nr:hypothetical protein [Enhygromyxa salina]
MTSWITASSAAIVLEREDQVIEVAVARVVADGKGLDELMGFEVLLPWAGVIADRRASPQHVRIEPVLGQESRVARVASSIFRQNPTKNI